MSWAIEDQLCNGEWENVSQTDGETTTFLTEEAARAELKDFLFMANDAGLDIDPDGYRVVEVPERTPALA